MYTQSRVRTFFCLVLTLCITLGTVGSVPAVVVAVEPVPDLSASLPQSVSVASWQSNGASDLRPSTHDPDGENSHTIRLKSRQFEPSSSDALSFDGAAGLGAERQHVLLQFDYIPRQAAKAYLHEQGIDLLTYVPDYAWIAALSLSDTAAALDLPGLTWIGELTVDDKLDPVIREGQWSDYNLHPDGTAGVHVILHGDENLDAGRSLVEMHGGTVTGQAVGIRLLVVEMPVDRIRALAAEDAIQWIEPVGPPLTPANDGIRVQIGVDILQSAPYNLDGTGIDVLVYDSGQVGDHADFGTRLIHGDTDAESEHSTHVAGTVGGDGTITYSQRGMAPNVDLISYGTEYSGSGVYFYSNVPDIEHDWAQAQNWFGADIGTASLSSNIYYNHPTQCSLMGNYGASSVLIDQIVRGGNSTVGSGDKYIATWAAGNERNQIGSCSDTYNSTSPPAGAKNPIHVGGSNTNNNTQYAHTSWGPTDDGRIKPIVTAGACQTTGDYGITSTDNSPVDSYTVMCGTSMATPAVAGGIALMLQHYRDVYNTTGTFWPSTAKAILMQTANDLGNAGPDYQWGYGQVNIHAAVDLISRKAFRQDSVADDAVDLYYLVVPDDGDPLTVSLAWDDYEATLNANPTLINNLDLELVAPSGTVWRPWVLNPSSPTALATRGVDNRNNQEQVQVPTPEIGTWIVRVHGTTVPQGPQDYSLVCEGCRPLDVGSCQGTVDGSTMAVATEMSAAEDQEEEQVTRLLSPELSTGEIWQRVLEAGTLPQESTVRLLSEEGELLYAAPGPVVSPAPDAAAVQEAEALVEAFAILNDTDQSNPEAIYALLETLSPQVLDGLNDEIAEALERLAASAPPPPERAPLSEAEEQAMAEAQRTADAVARDRALRGAEDPAENEWTGESAASPSPSSFYPAADRTVGSGCTYPTIAAAVAAADPGDRLLIEGGVTFYENITINKNLTLEGGYDGCASGSSMQTTIDGGGSTRVFEISAGLDVTLLNLEIINGDTSSDGGGIRFAAGGGTGTLSLNNVSVHDNEAAWGGGIWVGLDAQVTGAGVQIYDNNASTYGGGVRLYGGRMTIEGNSNIYQNAAPLGAGVYGSLIYTEEPPDPPVPHAPSLSLPVSADVHHNQALTGDGQGGGVYMREGTVYLSDGSDIRSNSAIEGGGLYLVTSTVTIDSTDSEIQYNSATGHGGGVYAQGSSVNLNDQAEIYDNHAGTGGSGSGGGAYLDDSDLWSDRASIRYNDADGWGGGVYATSNSTVDMDLESYTCLGTRCSQLYYNVTSEYHGGGIYASDSTVDLRNTYVESNVAGRLAGAVYAYESTVYAYDTLFARNTSGTTGYDGIRLYSGSTMVGQGLTLAYNDSGGAATGTAVTVGTSNLTLSCSIVWGHSTSIDSPTENVTYSDVEGGYAGTGNINANPLFVASASQDYHLQSTSPAIDRCLTGSSLDVDAETRPIVRSTAASPYDMGADEAAGIDRVGVNGTCAYSTIQQAIHAAQDGDTVRVSGGVYFETIDISNKSITVEGGYDSTCTSIAGDETRIEGSAGSGSTIDIDGGTVMLRHLQIAWGQDTGGGIDIRGGADVALEDSDVHHNHGSYGGGIYVDANSSLSTNDDSDIYQNTASHEGGGVRVWGAFYGYDTSSDIYQNCAPHGGGFYVPGGTLSLNASDVYQNEAADATGRGGGIYVTNGGVVTLTNTAYVYYDNRAYDGAGLYADAADVFLVGSGTTFRDNIASHYGGGLYLANGSTLTSNGARIGQASGGLANEASYGGGIYALDSTIEFTGRIINNLATSAGGGICADASTIHLVDAEVGGTGSYEANYLGPGGTHGAGLLLLNASQVTLVRTTVSSNAFQSTGTIYGGGAYVASSSVLTATDNSSIEHHNTPALANGFGGGLYVSGAKVILDGGHVLSNTAYTLGGGIRMIGSSTLVVSGNSTIAYNQTPNGEGGGIAARDIPDIDITDARLMYNSAGTLGGAIYVHSGALDLDRVVLHHNEAGSGGAIYQAVHSAAVSSYLTNVLLYANTTTAPSTASIHVAEGTMTMLHVTIADNLGGAGCYAQSGTTSSVFYSIAWGNADGGFTGSLADIECNTDQSGNAGTNTNPQFVGGGDYHLAPGSPAIDACNTGLLVDLDGLPRPSGPGFDRGAYEYQITFIYLPVTLRNW